MQQHETGHQVLPAARNKPTELTIPVAGNAASAYVIAQGWAMLGSAMMLAALAWTVMMAARHVSRGWAAGRADLPTSAVWACLGATISAGYIIAFNPV